MADSEESTSRKRKRSLNPVKYKRNIKRNAKVKDFAHINYSGKEVPAVNTGPDCNCRFKCFENFDDEQQNSILSNFLFFNNKDT